MNREIIKFCGHFIDLDKIYRISEIEVNNDQLQFSIFFYNINIPLTITRDLPVIFYESQGDYYGYDTTEAEYKGYQKCTLEEFKDHPNNRKIKIALNEVHSKLLAKWNHNYTNSQIEIIDYKIE